MLHQLTVPELSPAELAQALEAGEPIQVVDVRAPMRVAGGRIELAADEQFHNIVGSTLITLRNLQGTGIDPGVPVAVVCGHGNDSKVIALHLNQLGCEARSLSGGMTAWMMLVLPRDLPAPPSLDRLVQLDRVGKGALGYVLVSDGQALIVDPPRDPSAYLAAVDDSQSEIVGVADTHVHADYISGATGISQALGVPYYLHAADAVYPYDGTAGRLEFRALEDGDSIEFGRCSFRAMHTPGHTEGSLTYVVDNQVALTGDFVFVTSIGRPDLAGKTQEWTGQLWQSVQRAKRSWPPDLNVYPAHYGDDAERNSDRTVGGRFGDLAEQNEGLQFQDEREFAEWVESKSASFPDAYQQIKAINVGLAEVDESEADVLEFGKNECAIGGR